MKFEVSSSELLKKLSTAGAVIAVNPVLPITEAFLMKLNNNELTVTATNLETTIQSSIVVRGQQDGSVAIPGKILLDTLKALPDQPVSISADPENNMISLVSSYGKYQIAGNNPDDFPPVPAEESTESFTFEMGKLEKAITSTVFATSNDELRMAMTGVFMHLDYNKAVFVATDAHKLVKFVFGGLNTDISKSVIIPKKALNVVKSAILPEGEIRISFNNNNAFFNFENTLIVCRLIDAKYPDYNAVIPVDNDFTITLNRRDLLGSLKRISVYSNKSTYQVMFNISENSLTVSAQDLDFSNEATEQLSCRYDGEPMTVGYNSKFLIELLSVLVDDEVLFKVSNPNRAALIHPSDQESDEDLTMLIMPLFSTY
jgi:DNA polymerase III subunit beta